MPTASEKQTAKKTVLQEGDDPFKAVLIVVDRRVNNLEKKKVKLEGLKLKLAHGDRLEQPQREAVARYDQVLHNLEFAQELQKQFEVIANEAEKLQKRRLKKERMEKRVMEMRRVQELIELQSLLDSLGSEAVRSDLQTGKHGSLVFTNENLSQLDEFYQLICPSREKNNNYREETMKASIHLVNLLDSSQKEIVGSTYKQIKELLTFLSNCGYFERSNVAPKEITESIASVDETKMEEDDNFTTSTGQLATDNSFQQFVQDHFYGSEERQADSTTVVEDNSDKTLYYAPNIKEPELKPISDIVTKGNFNFLQDSIIDFDSTPSDPAIVAVQLSNQKVTHTLVNHDYTDTTFIDQSDQSWADASSFPNDDNLCQSGIMESQAAGYPNLVKEMEGEKFTRNAKAPVFTSLIDNNNGQTKYKNYKDGDCFRGNRSCFRGRKDTGDNPNVYHGGSRGRGFQGRNHYKSEGYQNQSTLRSDDFGCSDSYQGKNGIRPGYPSRTRAREGERGGQSRGGPSHGNRTGGGVSSIYGRLQN